MAGINHYIIGPRETEARAVITARLSVLVALLTLKSILTKLKIKGSILVKKSKILLLGLIAIAIGSYFLFDLGQYLTLDFVQSQLAALQTYKNDNFATAAAIYFVGYVVATGLSIPGAILITLMGGAIFGVFWGTLLVSFASSIGALVRHRHRRWLEKSSGY